MKKLLLFLFLVTGLSAQPLWQKTTVGMSESELRQMYPEAKPAEDGKGLTLVTTIATHMFDVGLRLDDAKKLKNVHLSSFDKGNTQNGPAFFQEMATLLRAKYGKETSSENAGMKRSLTWLSPERTSIQLELFSPGRGYFLTIDYSNAVSKEADKL